MEIYIGDPVEHESERSVLREIERVLVANGGRAIVFANFSVASRQIDLLVAIDGLVLVVEAKAIKRPVRGGENGPWEVRLASGAWKEFRNPYRQALDAVLAVKDAVRSFSGGDPPFIGSALLFIPEIPPGSNAYPGDKKVSVIGKAELSGLLRKGGGSSWSDHQWRAFAEHLKLTRVDSVFASCDPRMVEAERRLRHYKAMYLRTYRDSEDLVSFSCDSKEGAISSSEVVHLALEQCGGVLLHGRSGCGKSMLAESVGVAFISRGGVAVCIQGKDFGGWLKKAIDHEAGLLGAPSGTTLLNDARLLDRPILLIVDGYNECPENRRGMLTRAIAALAYKYAAGIIVTSQIPLVRGDLLELQKLDVPPPTMETKVAIAERASNERVPPDHFEHLLTAVSTGLEARLVGEVGVFVPLGSSRYALFDAYARKRLGELAGVCIRALSQVAAWLFDRLTFRMSIRDFDRLMDRQDVSAEDRRVILSSGLLTTRGDMVSFAHEMFLDAFAAEAVVRQAGDRPEAILQSLSAPKHASRKDLIIGAIDDECMLARLLPGLEDSASVRACLAGHCGSLGQEWAEQRCRRLWIELRDEARNVRFRKNPRSWNGVEFDKGNARWTRADHAFFGVLAGLVLEGRHVEKAFDAIGVLDCRMAHELRRLSDETKSDEAELRTGMFAIGYGYVFPQGSSGTPGISRICASLHNGTAMVRDGSTRTSDDPTGAIIRKKLAGRDLSPGQLFLFLTLCRGAGISASFIRRIIETQWDVVPYHLRLDLLYCAGIHSVAEDDAELAELIEAVEGLLRRGNQNVTDTVIETLQFLGALDDDAKDHRAVVAENVRRCLARPTESESHAEAWCIYGGQFDHPYSEAYCEVVSDLAEGERKSLLDMAARGAPDTSFWIVLLLLELTSFGDRRVGKSIARWTALPAPNNSFMPQQDIKTYVVAHIALARLGCPLPDNRTDRENPSARALEACGAILYWSNRRDVCEEETFRVCRRELKILSQEGRCSAIDVIRECEFASLMDLSRLPGDGPVVHSIIDQFPDEVAAISRDALCEPDSLVGYFGTWSDSNKRENLSFAISVLKHHGTGSDRPLLREYASKPEFGDSAIDALKAIEERLSPEPESAASRGVMTGSSSRMASE